jgi:hypothetical protein
MRNRRSARLLAAVALAWLLPAAGRAEDTVSGEVVDLACYLAHPATSTGAGHRKCAETCAKKGMPLGILTEDKQVVLLLEDHDDPKPYAQVKEKAAQKVTVRGEKVSQGGLTGIVTRAVE